MDIVLALTAIVIGLVVLVFSADKFVLGASGTAYRLGMSPFLIGMLIVGFGTSAPEMLVSLISALEGNPGIAIGNAYGSNIANIGLILGVTALLIPISVKPSIIFRELPILIGVTLLSLVLILLHDDLMISRLDAWILIAAFVLTTFASVKLGKKDQLQEENQGSCDLSLKSAIAWLVVGLLLMMASSRALVWGAVEIAKMLEVPDVIIGLTIVAIGTSLPELASSIVAARKGEADLAMGNIVGSNLFNTLIVVGIAGVIKDIKIEQAVLTRDFAVMLFLTIILLPLGYKFNKKQKYGTIGRASGAFFLAIYVAYTAYLVLLALKLVPDFF